MALPTNTFRPRRYFRSKFREAKYLLAAEATDLQLESFEQLRDYIKKTFGDIAVGTAFKVEKIAADELVVRPGEAWNKGIPYVLRSGTDAMVIEGELPTDVTLEDLSRTVSDIGGKKLIFGASCPNDNYSMVVESSEEIVREAGSSGAVDAFLKGVNVGEGTQHKFRFVYKVHVVPTIDLDSSPTYPLASGTKHFINEIEITPTAGNYYLISSLDITPDINGADRQVIFKNDGVHKVPFAADANDFIFGKLVDSDGNIFTITSITTSDGGNNVTMLLDRAVAPGSLNPKADQPVITTDVPFKLIKRDHYVTDTNGLPLGKHYYRIADFTFNTPTVSEPSDLRVVTQVNTFGVDHNVRLREGGVISWNLDTEQLGNTEPYEITIPGLLGKALIAGGFITLSNVGDVAYVILDREAEVDYFVTPTVVQKENVPSNVDVYIFAERGEQRVYFPHNGSIGDSESGYLGGFGSELAKDLSRDTLTDMLTELQMDEVFAETFDLPHDVDLVNSQSMTFEQFNKLLRAGSSARFIDYYANTLPNTDPVNPWTLLGNAGFAGVSSKILTLEDTSAVDFVGYRRIESSLNPLAHSEHKLRLRVLSGTGASPFVHMVQDGPTGKHFGLRWSTTDVALIDGSGSVLGSYAMDTSSYHTYELVKFGSVAVQWYVDGVRRGVVKYSDITTAGSDTSIEWSTDSAEQVEVDIDYVLAKIYTSIFQSKDIYRKGEVFYEADVLPAADSTPWVKVDGAGGITEIIDDNHLVLTDTVSTNLINYYREESGLTRHGTTEIDFRVKIDSIGLLDFKTFGFRLEDGFKDISVWLQDVAGQLRVGMHNTISESLVSSLFVLDYDVFNAIKIRKKRDDQVELLINNVLVASHSYEEFDDAASTDKKISFGSFDVDSEYEATIDYIQYNLPGSGALAASPVRDILAVVNSDDPAPIVWASSDNGKTWFRINHQSTTSITNSQETGANLLVRIGLARMNSALTDYGIYYNKSGFEVDGPFRFTTITATAGQTVFELPFAYTPGVNELIVSALYVAGDSRELFLGDDYIEDDSTHITLTSPAAAGDKFKFRVIFVKDPVVVPLSGSGFLGHDHDGSSGESDVLNPTEVNVTNDVNVGGDLNVDNNVNVDGDLNVDGYINGASPVKLSGDDTGVTVGTGSLNSGTLEHLIQTDSGATPSLKLKRASHEWKLVLGTFSTFEELSADYNGTYRLILGTDGMLNLANPGTASTDDTGIELRINNNAQRWKMYIDNSDSDKLKFSYNGTDKLAIRTDNSFEYSRPTGTSVGIGGVAIAGTSGSWTTADTNFQLVTNQSISLETTGRPVQIILIPDTSSSHSYVATVSDNLSGSTSIYDIRRNGTSLGTMLMASNSPEAGTSSETQRIPPAFITTIDTPPAGTHTYTLHARSFSMFNDTQVRYCRLTAYEL